MRCSESTTAAPSPSTAREEHLGRIGIELRRRLVEQEQRGPQRQRRGEADPLELAAGELGRPPTDEMQRVHRRERLLDAPGISSGGVPTFSRPKATSFSTLAITTCSSGSWKTVATVPARSAGRARRVSCPATTTRPANRPPWKCGTRPAKARSSVDLPEPDGPSSATDSPGASSSETAVERRALRARVRERKGFHPR